MKLDLIKEYKDLSLFLVKSLQGSVAGDRKLSRSLNALLAPLEQAATAGQIKRIHRQIKDLLIKEEPVDVNQLLETTRRLKEDLLAQSNIENDLRLLIEDFKSLVEAALHHIESLSLQQDRLELFLECRSELREISTPEDMNRYVRKFKRLFSGNFLPTEEIVKERDELKKIISILANSISNLLLTSGEFDSGLEECVARLQRAHSLNEVQEIRNLLIEQTRNLQVRTRQMAKDMQQAREQVDDANKKIEALKNQMEKIKKEVVIDPLTRIFNRRAFDTKIRQEMISFQRYGQLTSLIIIDIDHFKRINDSYGHRTGDGVLRILSEVMKKEIREVDFLARYGGEEFALILPHTPFNQALEVAERIRSKVESSRFTYKGKPFVVTISLGVGTLRKDDTLESFFTRVDEALYRAKRNGRNQVVGEE
ncbi:MAG: diguanylate cyclase [Deltaproteobacteria bacterium]|nr:diguanylate cyclase [Deltaproteobacteria bacterium]